MPRKGCGLHFEGVRSRSSLCNKDRKLGEKAMGGRFWIAAIADYDKWGPIIEAAGIKAE